MSISNKKVTQRRKGAGTQRNATFDVFPCAFAPLRFRSSGFRFPPVARGLCFLFGANLPSAEMTEELPFDFMKARLWQDDGGQNDEEL